MLGRFQAAKYVLHCTGKSIKGSGLDEVLTETRVFGAIVLEAVLAGTHYVRSFRRMFIL